MPFNNVRHTGKHVRPLGKHIKPQGILEPNKYATCSVDGGPLDTYYEGPRGPIYVQCEFCQRIYDAETGTLMLPLWREGHTNLISGALEKLRLAYEKVAFVSDLPPDD